MSVAPSASVHSVFSLGRIQAIAHNTFIQLVRMKVFYFMLIFALVVIGASFVFLQFNPEEELKLIKNVAFGTMSLFGTVIAIAATAILIPRDIEDRTLYTILCKPVPRYEYLLSKFIGIMLLILFGLIIMALMSSAVLHVRKESVLTRELEMIDNGPRIIEKSELDINQEKEVIRKAISRHGPTLDFQKAIFVIFLKSAIIAAASLFISTFATSTLFTILTGFALYIIGHGQALARDYVTNVVDGGAGFLKLLSLLVAIIFPDLSMLGVVDSVVRGDALPWDALSKITTLSLVYIILYLSVSCLIFSDKEL